MLKRRKVVGEKFGRLSVVSEVEPKGYARMFECKCDCGNMVQVYMSNLVNKNNHTKSCGCLSIEIGTKRLTKHGHVSNGKWSGEYHSWAHMISRCTNPNVPSYKDYGGRGISVCKQWMGSDGFKTFLNDMGKKPSKDYSLDRYPNNETGNYEPSNCRWATEQQQQSNKRSNHWEEYNGERKIINEWARVLGVRQNLICKRLKKQSFSEMIDRYHSEFKQRVA